MLNLSQQDYVNRIDELNQALISAWDQDQRVKALKIAIQVRKGKVVRQGDGPDEMSKIWRDCLVVMNRERYQYSI